MLKLIIEDDEGRKTVVPFVRDEITIGRQEGNTIRLTERNVSRRHARLVRQNGHVLVEDLGSYNGIRINGDRIQGQVQIGDGDLIQIGDYDLAVQREEALAAAAAKENATTKDLEPVRSTAPTQRLADHQATMPALPTVKGPNETLAADGEPEEADPNDVSPAPGSAQAEELARRQSTAIIRMDQVEASRPRQVHELDASETPRLVVLNTELAGREFPCGRTELRIGRTDDNDIALDHRSLSRTHAKVVREETGEWRVIDMQSQNGLMVNGEAYAQSALRSGDVLELGHVKLKFVGPGESFSVSASETGEVERSGSKLPIVALAVVAVVALVGGGYFVFKKKPVNHTQDPVVMVKPPPEPPGPKVVVPPTPPPEVELTPEQQRAETERKLTDARAKIEALDWEGARTILKSCFVGESPCPEANRLLLDLKNEEPLRAAIDRAEKLIDEGKLVDGKEQLDSAEHTTLLQTRLAAVRSKLQKASQDLLQQSATRPPRPPVVVPPPRPVEPPKPPSETPAHAEARKNFEEGVDLYKGGSYPGAKAKFEKCLKADPTYAECHMKLGATYAKLDDSASGLKHYQMFVKLAPDHPMADKVRHLIEQYKGSK